MSVAKKTSSMSAMATPFSPFVGRPAKPLLKRRQSELPSDLIDWDAPEIPELEKQRIIYEDYIKETSEDHEIESLLNEQIFKVAHDTVVETYQASLKKLEDDINKERATNHLLLGQIKMFESNVEKSDERIDELENEVAEQREAIDNLKHQLEHDKENWMDERANLKSEIEDLNFRNNETICERNHNLEIYIQKKNEAEDCRKKLDAVKNQLSYYKKLAKNKDNKNFE